MYSTKLLFCWHKSTICWIYHQFRQPVIPSSRRARSWEDLPSHPEGQANGAGASWCHENCGWDLHGFTGILQGWNLINLINYILIMNGIYEANQSLPNSENLGRIPSCLKTFIPDWDRSVPGKKCDSSKPSRAGKSCGWSLAPEINLHRYGGFLSHRGTQVIQVIIHL